MRRLLFCQNLGGLPPGPSPQLSPPLIKCWLIRSDFLMKYYIQFSNKCILVSCFFQFSFLFFNFHFGFLLFFSFFNFGFFLLHVLRTTALELLWWRNISFFRNSLIFSLNFFSNSSFFEYWRIFLCIFELLLYINFTMKLKAGSPINKVINEQMMANPLKRKIHNREAYKIRLVISWAVS